MRRMQYVAALALFSLVTSTVHADTVRMGRTENSQTCFDWIRITRSDGCQKLIIRDCDNYDPCGWVDGGWACLSDGGNVLSGGILLPSAYDSNGNLVCDVAPGYGGIFTPHQQSDVCFAPTGGSPHCDS